MAQAQHDVDAIARALAGEYPATNRSKGLHLTSLQGFMVRRLRAILMLLMAAILAVPLIAATNVAGLLLARGQRRLPEMAMRSALGASRWRLVRQLLTESVLLTAVAGALGIGVTALSLSLLASLLSLGTLGIGRPPIDGRTLLVASVLSIATGLLVGIVPALRAAGVGPANWLGAGRQHTEGRRSLRLRSAFVVAQVAVSVVLLGASVLFIRNVVGLTPAQIGFAADGVYTARVALSPPRYLDSAQRGAFLESVLASVSALPGVVSAAAINKLPILDPMQDWGVWPVNRPPAAPEDTLSAMARWVTPGYFKTMGIPILAGRDISARDVEGAPQVIVISDQVARRLFPGQHPLGRRAGVVDHRHVRGRRRRRGRTPEPDARRSRSGDVHVVGSGWESGTAHRDQDRRDPTQLANALFVIELGSRHVHLAGCTSHPNRWRRA